MRKILFGGLGLLLAALVVACANVPSVGKGEGPAAPAAVASEGAQGAPGEHSAGPKGFKVGEHATVNTSAGGSGDYVVSSIKHQGNVLVATITIKCTAGSIDYNMFSWTMVGGDNAKLSIGADLDVPHPLGSGTLATGQTITGTVQFEGSEQQLHGARVVYTAIFGGDLAYWTTP